MKYDPYVLTTLIQLIMVSNSSSTNALADQSARILRLVNAERAKAGMQPLKIDIALNKLALLKSQDMVEKDYFSHHSPTHGSCFDMMRSHGLNYIYAGENLAIDNYADNAHIAWMNSKTHSGNILNPNFTEIGIGICAKRNDVYIYTELFIGK